MRGDVEDLYWGSGNFACHYTYDTWGNVISVTDINGKEITNANHIGLMNPIRYRGYYFDSEIGMYYLQSRYYNPQVGRFISADNLITSVGGNTLGNNLFAYCMNCPTNMSDYSGHAPQWLKNAVKWTATNIIKPVVKAVQKTLSKVNFTYSTGYNISGSPSFWNFNGQIGASFDTKGNMSFQITGGGGVTTGTPSISVTRYYSVTNAPKISKLEGRYYQVGGSVATLAAGVPIAAGGDAMIMPDEKENRAYFGLTGNVGLGVPGKELHVEWGETMTLTNEINIYDVAGEIYIKIMEW